MRNGNGKLKRCLSKKANKPAAAAAFPIAKIENKKPKPAAQKVHQKLYVPRLTFTICST